MWKKWQLPQSSTPTPYSTLNKSPPSIHHSSAYIFDDTYKTKLQKNKFEHNPKFAYFNAILKMRKKLSVEQHQVYEMIFDPEAHAGEDGKKMGRNRKFMNAANNGRSGSRNGNGSGNGNGEVIGKGKLITDRVGRNQGGLQKTERKSVQEISFDGAHRHKRRQSQFYYDERPRLDDILAEYRKMSKRENEKEKSKSFYLSRSKKGSKQYDIFNRTTKLFSRQFPQQPNIKKH